MEESDNHTVEQGHDDANTVVDDSKLDYKPARNLCHKLFILISVLTGLCALWMAIGQVLGFVVYENTPVEYTLRAYIIVFCILVILVELEWTKFVRESRLLSNWITRGLIYVFIGVLGLQENEGIVKEGATGYETMLEIVKAVAWNMIGCGLLYFVMGICCLQLVLDRMRKHYQERVVRAKQHNKKQSTENDDGEGVEAVLDQSNKDVDEKDTDEEMSSRGVETDVEAQNTSEATVEADSRSDESSG